MIKTNEYIKTNKNKLKLSNILMEIQARIAEINGKIISLNMVFKCSAKEKLMYSDEKKICSNTLK